MSDPTDLAEIGKHVGSGGAGAVLYGIAARFLIGAGISDIKERLMELKADTKEQITGVKELIERSDRRHDLTIAEVALAKRTADAAHSRYDALETRVAALERESRGGH